jgi:hypothetical protein
LECGAKRDNALDQGSAKRQQIQSAAVVGALQIVGALQMKAAHLFGTSRSASRVTLKIYPEDSLCYESQECF